MLDSIDEVENCPIEDADEVDADADDDFVLEEEAEEENESVLLEAKPVLELSVEDKIDEVLEEPVELAVDEITLEDKLDEEAKLDDVPLPEMVLEDTTDGGDEDDDIDELELERMLVAEDNVEEA